MDASMTRFGLAAVVIAALFLAAPAEAGAPGGKFTLAEGQIFLATDLGPFTLNFETKDGQIITLVVTPDLDHDPSGKITGTVDVDYNAPGLAGTLFGCPAVAKSKGKDGVLALQAKFSCEGPGIRASVAIKYIHLQGQSQAAGKGKISGKAPVGSFKGTFAGLALDGVPLRDAYRDWQVVLEFMLDPKGKLIEADPQFLSFSGGSLTAESVMLTSGGKYNAAKQTSSIKAKSRDVKGVKVAAKNVTFSNAPDPVPTGGDLSISLMGQRFRMPLP